VDPTTKERNMNYTVILSMVAMLGAGQAAAESVKPGFDRVGLVSADFRHDQRPNHSGLSQARFTAARGEGNALRADSLPQRRVELARRLVWLMLSAR
jgi:hypothetical protein